MKYEDYKRLTPEEKEEYDFKFKDNDNSSFNTLGVIFSGIAVTLMIGGFKALGLATLYYGIAIIFVGIGVNLYILLKEHQFKKKVSIK